MRLQLTLTALAGTALVGVAGAAHAIAPPDVQARVDVYHDGSITVVSPATSAAVEVNDAVEVEASYAIDVLSGATRALTVDAISSATHFSERRHEVHGAVTGTLSTETSLSAAYSVSLEPDYITHAISGGFATELFERMSALSVTYRLNVERFGVARSPLDQRLLGHNVDLSWAQILGPGTLLTFLASTSVSTCSDRVGCHASPYRYVGVTARGDKGRMVAVGERHPDLRVRAAGAVRLAQHLGGGVALHAGYRAYGDNWAIHGHTVDTAVALSLLAEQLVLRAEGRFTWQGAASFYREDYTVDDLADGPPEYRTDDREMAGLWDVMAALRVEWSLVGPEWLEVFRLNARVAHFWFRYPTYDELPSREAWLVGLGATAEF